MLETFNPEKNHVYNRFWKPFRDEKETVETKFLKVLPSDNPHPSVNGWIEDIIKKGDKRIIQRLIYGNFDYDDSDNSLCNFDKILDIFTNTFVKGGQKYMSCDIAINNDAFVIVNWDGMRVEDIKYMTNISPTKIETKVDGTQNSIIDFKPLTALILQQAHKYNVPRTNIVWDADGIGHTMIRQKRIGVSAGPALESGGLRHTVRPRRSCRRLRIRSRDVAPLQRRQ